MFAQQIDHTNVVNLFLSTSLAWSVSWTITTVGFPGRPIKGEQCVFSAGYHIAASSSLLPSSFLECLCGEKGAAGMIFRDNLTAREGASEGKSRGRQLLHVNHSRMVSDIFLKNEANVLEIIYT